MTKRSEYSLIGCQEISEYVGLDWRTLKPHVDDGTFPVSRNGAAGQWMSDTRAVDQWLFDRAQQRRHPSVRRRHRPPEAPTLVEIRARADEREPPEAPEAPEPKIRARADERETCSSAANAPPATTSRKKPNT